MLASLAKKGCDSFSGKARKMNHLSSLRAKRAIKPKNLYLTPILSLKTYTNYVRNCRLYWLKTGLSYPY
ncbi:MAG: hypothetical protein U5L45_26450 [Saprospiraceae bacterium]|nr:hypothetical protein [Saprospiraceae bacterium]